MNECQPLLDGLAALEHLLLQGNLVSNIEEMRHLAHLPGLKTLYLKNVDGSQPNPAGPSLCALLYLCQRK